MPVSVVPLATLSDLHEFVRQNLCARDRLDLATTPFFSAEIKRRGQPCGFLFHIEGPRQMKNSAVWSDEENRILFYDSIGTRFHEVRLSDSPAIDEPLRRAA